MSPAPIRTTSVVCAVDSLPGQHTTPTTRAKAGASHNPLLNILHVFIAHLPVSKFLGQRTAAGKMPATTSRTYLQRGQAKNARRERNLGNESVGIASCVGRLEGVEPWEGGCPGFARNIGVAQGIHGDGIGF